MKAIVAFTCGNQEQLDVRIIFNEKGLSENKND